MGIVNGLVINGAYACPNCKDTNPRCLGSSSWAKKEYWCCDKCGHAWYEPIKEAV
jgi:hypothetical protein